MKDLVKKYAAWVGYPLFYLGTLAVFSYVCFPFGQLKDRIVAEYNSTRSSDTSPRLEIDEISWSWRFPGITIEGVRLIGPKPASKKEARRVVTIDDAYATVSLIPLLWGTTDVTFAGDAFGGSVEAEIGDDSSGRSVLLELSDVDPGQLPEVADAVGLPIGGLMSGKVELHFPGGKTADAEGEIELEILDFWLGDGKAKIRNTLALPRLDIGEFRFTAAASKGRVDIEELSASGNDLTIISDGKIRLRERLETSLAEVNFRFKFSDVYKTKSDITKGLFGDPKAKGGGLFDLDPKNKRAKREDGFYSWKITGPLANLSFQPIGDKAVGKKRGRKDSWRRKKPKGRKRPKEGPRTKLKDRGSKDDEGVKSAVEKRSARKKGRTVAPSGVPEEPAVAPAAPESQPAAVIEEGEEEEPEEEAEEEEEEEE